jgi:hypothetical protein
MGAIGTRLSLRPTSKEGKRNANLGQIMSRECERASSSLFDIRILDSPRHREKRSDEAIHASAYAARWIASLRSQ